jgi:hypothetical protein
LFLDAEGIRQRRRNVEACAVKSMRAHRDEQRLDRLHSAYEVGEAFLDKVSTW